MSGTFFGLEVARRALNAQQTGLDVTNHNVANANTKGFSRQRVHAVATSPLNEQSLNRPEGAAQVGTGVIVQSIQRYRDTFIDLQYRSALGAREESRVKRDGLEEVEVILNENTETGLSNQVAQFFQSWQLLTNNPTEAAARSTVIQQSAVLAETFNRVSEGLTSVQTDLNNAVTSSVGSINSIIREIDELNRQITEIEVTGQTANDPRDRRDSLLDQISAMVPITVVDNANGAVNVSINGHNLVSLGNVDYLVTLPTGPGGMLQVAFSSDSTLVNLSSGELKGIVETRDTYVPSYIAKLDTIAADLITAVNGVHSAGFGLDNISGRDFFTGTNAATIAVNTVLVANPDRIATAAAPNQPGDSSIALAIAQLRTTMSPATDAAYASLVSVLGVDSRTEQDRYANLDTLTRIQDRRRANVSGVSLDEEAADMVRYQRAYEAAARVLTTYDQLLDTLINRTGLAGR